MNRLEKITALAEATAVKLVKNGLVSDDPRLEPLCKKLGRLKPLLRGRDLDEARIKSLLTSGLAMVKLKPGHGTDEEEAIRLLDALADKLGSMSSMFGAFL